MANKVHPKEAWFDWARNELGNLDKAKADIIKTLAEGLEKSGLPLDMICEEISNGLADASNISPGYVRFVLPDKYKNKKKQTSISKSGETLLIDRDRTNAVHKNNFSEKSSSSKSSLQDFDTDQTDIFSKEVEVEFDLKQGLEMGLRDSIKECEDSNTLAWIVKMRFKNGLVKRIENEITGLIREDLVD